jgi:hypothetical protein
MPDKKLQKQRKLLLNPPKTPLVEARGGLPVIHNINRKVRMQAFCNRAIVTGPL